MKKLLIITALMSVIIISGYGSNKETTERKSNEVIKTEEPKKSDGSKKNKGLEKYTSLKIGETVPIKYHESAEGSVAFDFILNKIEFTDQSLNGKSPEYESGFVILDVTLKNTGKEPLDVALISGMKYGTSMVVLGERYGFEDLSKNKELGLKESITGKMIVQYPKKGDQLTWGLEGFTTTFSYDIKADEIGDYVPE
ncbi:MULTISPECIES: hypothetical protein [Carnobacterium]|uniref:hypothetical protein n=1 Tax=Carnobacterium TaxID=2747 RepID=UPI00288FC411|nr:MULTISPECIES: hypothetical protein [Carnobacterium]MDT1940122.1 hypothetical protein [Carnobacterium divergens]MDT1942560.1 hypothetical protein [Carnobacterium divergens]MDT1948366.1 hypothetical protein [Carnobacterium divergens]MDT1950846.1 hypothetical protein [Carnobacterium divergens]MDT1955676.1 hypothetical protein [Carnobacterium divergens]